MRKHLDSYRTVSEKLKAFISLVKRGPEGDILPFVGIF